MVLLVWVMLMVTFTKPFQMFNRVLFLMAGEIFGDISIFLKSKVDVDIFALYIFSHNLYFCDICDNMYTVK